MVVELDDNHLMAIITTAGFDLIKSMLSTSNTNIANKLLDPDNPISNEQYLVMINELDEGDDVKNPYNWIKANPILCSI